MSLLYFSSVFVRRKKNKSGVISVQIIDKSSGEYQLYRTVGSSADLSEVENLYKAAKQEIEELTGQQKLPYDFDLVITRLVYPVSKLKTVDYLFKYKGIVIDVEKVYRYLDKLQAHQIHQVQQISYEHTLKILDNCLTVVFYDVTTLYFEAEDEDDFRKTGFRKDGKHQQPQIVLGLLASAGGYQTIVAIYFSCWWIGAYRTFEIHGRKGDCSFLIKQHPPVYYRPQKKYKPSNR